MARKFLTPIDLNKLELQNAVIQNLANPPANPVLGQIYFDTDLGYLRTCTDPGDPGNAIAPTWVNASIGNDGAQGTTGAQGIQGETGTQGAQGTQGIQGEQGLQGFEGAQGTAGTDALWNYTGAYSLGASYAVGDVATYEGQLYYRTDAHGGNQGDTPYNGSAFWDLIAAQGVQGTTGAQGAQGETGTQGIQGTQGETGTQGIQGEQGLQGYEGAQGIQGEQGLQGFEGTQGTQGIQGIQGYEGMQGTQGTQGIQGENAGILSVGSGLSLNVGTGELTVDTDTIATKAYVDATAQGLDVKPSVAVASSTNIDVANPTLDVTNTYVVIDGQNLGAGERALLRGQTSIMEQRIYVVTVGLGLEVADDTDNTNLTNGSFTFVERGTDKGKGFVFSPVAGGPNWTQFSETGNYITSVDTTSFDVTAGELSLQSTVAGDGLLLTSGVLAVDYSEVVKKYVGTITPESPYSQTSWNFEHGLGTNDVTVLVRDANGNVVEADITSATNGGTGLRTVTVGFAVAPANGETYTVVIHA